MLAEKRMKLLKVALVAFGLTYTFGLYFLMTYWSNAWTWTPPQPEYEQMMMGVYATLGVFLILAARDPLKNKSLIWFTVWSNIVHATIMLVQALNDPSDYANLYGDIPVLYLAGFVLAWLMPKSSE